MGRATGVVAAIFLACVALPAGAAELTRVASSGDPDNPFDLDLSVRWDRVQRRGRVTREVVQAAGPGQPAQTVDRTELRLNDLSNELVGRLAVGLYRDVELHVEVPYVLGREGHWRFGQLPDGSPAGPAGSTITGNQLEPDGTACSGACPAFEVGPEGTTLFQGGVVGDVTAGLAWAVFNDRRDDTKPTWVVGLDATLPSARRYDPAAGRGSVWLTPYDLPTSVGPVGRKIWKFDAWTALSKRMGRAEPYFRAHVTAMRKSSGTYSNCDQVALALQHGQASQLMVDNCALPQWREAAGARLPWEAGLAFGAELVPYEDAPAGQKVAFDLRVTADYTSSARWFNELTDATGKLHWTDPHLTVTGTLGLVFKASDTVSLRGSASLGTTTAHFLTGEPLGARDGADQNPNFDWRWDAPGRRFRVDEQTTFAIQVTGLLQF